MDLSLHERGLPLKRRAVSANLIALALNAGLLVLLLSVKSLSPSESARLVLLGFAPLLAWQLWLLLGRRATRLTATPVEFSARLSHWFQPVFQGVIILYWGWYWRDWYARGPEFLAQLLFAYVLDFTLTRARGRVWRLTPALLPTIISLNFFLWFRTGYFELQLALVAVAVLSKTFLVRGYGKERRHIFNPSGFALAFFGVLMLTPRFALLTRLPELAELFHVIPHMLELVVLLAAVVNLGFQTLPITGMAMVGMFLMDQVYILVLGAPIGPYPIDAFILLGATLLVTDPATSPSNQLGRALFGLAYGILVPLFSLVLDINGLPGPLDKIFPVPILNYLMPRFDRWGTILENSLRGFRWSTIAAKVAGNRWAQSVLYVSFVIVAMPLFRVHRPISINHSTFFPASFELIERQRHIGMLCHEHPDVCSPFNFVAEFRYWRER